MSTVGYTAPTIYSTGSANVNFRFASGGAISASYFGAGSPTHVTQTVQFAPNAVQAVPGVAAQLVPGSLLLKTSSGGVLSDNALGVVRELVNGGFVNRGTVNYANGTVALSSWNTGISSTVSRESTLSTVGSQMGSNYCFRTAVAPLRPGSLSIQFARSTGGTQTVTAAANGTISATGVVGTVDYETGLVALSFGSEVNAAGNEAEPWYNAANVVSGKIWRPDPVLASTVLYTAVAYTYLPLNADLVGIDPVRLPSDGRVPIFRAGSMVVVGNTKVTGPLTPTTGQTVNLGRVRLSRAVVRDSAGTAVNSGYTVNLEAGTLTFTNVSGMSMPVTIEDRIEDMAVAQDVQISGQITFTRQLSHAYPTAGTYVSSALEYGDKRARVSVVFDQATWDGTTWADSLNGTAATGTYNTVLAPIEVTNAGASTERWAVQFTSTTAFRVVGEHVGVVATGDINTDCAPINPATGQPYFRIRPAGWGAGWSVGNIVRFNTVGALCPAWIVRTVQPGAEAGTNYSFDILTRGDVDRP